ncbi:unnamed protein product [Blepharisma stoltei]|uniref:NAD-dependent epimerase/dehydratase domain-containing protein n=1 Tax=Blepharisma stoltei TaxID=1481888 RepID=A0AAU9JH30_9CILI|nr:unnamed protein product [Blepharisma stoltei]
MEAPSWLILGGVGYIGRNLVMHLLENNLASHITVADKVVPAMAHLHPRYEEIFSRVEFVQTDLSRNPAKAFTREFDYIVNLAGETRSGMPESAHRQSSVGVISACKDRVGRAKWIEISSAKVYRSSNRPNNEESSPEPWTLEGTWRLNAERALEGVNHVVLRPGLVYGKGDLTTLTPRAVLAAVYRRMKKKMKVLWGSDLRINTVYISDLINAIVHTKDLNGVFNVADPSNTTQEDVNRILQDLFKVKCSYYSRTISNLASLHAVAEEANQIHMAPWAELCAESGVDSPISPFVEEENLNGSHICVDGSRITQTGFAYQHPRITAELLTESLGLLIEAGVLPNILNSS